MYLQATFSDRNACLELPLIWEKVGLHFEEGLEEG